MKTKNYPLTSTITALLSLLLAIGTATIFRACPSAEDGTWMHCHEVQTIIIMIASAMTVMLAGAMFTNNKTYHRVVYVACTIAAAVIVFLPGIIMSMCMMRSMRCYTHMQPYARIMGGIIFTICLDKVVKLFKKQ